MNTEFGYVPVGIELTLYYSVVSLIGLLFFVYLRKDKFSIFLFLIFFSGAFAALGELIDNSFKIFLLFLTVLLFLDTKQKLYIDIKFVIIFILFSIAFWFSIYLNHNPIIYSLSQYSKYLIPFLIYLFIINKLIIVEDNEYYLQLIIKLILLQVLFSVIKFFIIGFSESVVGSIVYLGGSSAAILPVIGLMILYILKKEYMGKKEIFQVLLMLIISIMSNKRIVWFLLPAIILGLSIAFGHVKYLKYALLAIPIIIYLGVRINPTLNKEFKIWGSFDLEYAIEYSQSYYGLKNVEDKREKSFGRIAGNFQMLNYIGKEINNYKTWFGNGPKAIYNVSYKDYNRQNNRWGVADKGSLTGGARFLIAYGLIGLVLYLIFIIYLFIKIRHKGFKILITVFFLFEFFFYLDTIIFLPIIIPILLLSNYISLTALSKQISFFTRAQHSPVINTN